ncbi:MAG: hypothetical protein V4577_27375 [Bacteroidota bacterium]
MKNGFNITRINGIVLKEHFFRIKAFVVIFLMGKEAMAVGVLRGWM